MHVNRRRIFWGIVVLCIAAAVLSSLLGFFTWADIQIWWPAIPAVLALASLVSGHLNGWNFGVLGFSVWLLLCHTGVIPTDHGFLLAVAVFLGVMGVWLILTAIFPGLRRRKYKPFIDYVPAGGTGTGPCPNTCSPVSGNQSTVFSDANYVCADNPFTHGKYSTVFGDVNIDLRPSQIADGAVLDISCVFGDVHVLVPQGCRVRLEGSHVFGDVKAGQFPTDDSLPLFTIRHSAVFGDVTVM